MFTAGKFAVFDIPSLGYVWMFVRSKGYNLTGFILTWNAFPVTTILLLLSPNQIPNIGDVNYHTFGLFLSWSELDRVAVPESDCRWRVYAR